MSGVPKFLHCEGKFVVVAIETGAFTMCIYYRYLVRAYGIVHHTTGNFALMEGIRLQVDLKPKV